MCIRDSYNIAQVFRHFNNALLPAADAMFRRGLTRRVDAEKKRKTPPAGGVFILPCKYLSSSALFDGALHHADILLRLRRQSRSFQLDPANLHGVSVVLQGNRNDLRVDDVRQQAAEMCIRDSTKTAWRRPSTEDKSPQWGYRDCSAGHR